MAQSPGSLGSEWQQPCLLSAEGGTSVSRGARGGEERPRRTVYFWQPFSASLHPTRPELLKSSKAVRLGSGSPRFTQRSVRSPLPQSFSCCSKIAGGLGSWECFGGKEAEVEMCYHSGMGYSWRSVTWQHLPWFAGRWGT